MWLKGVQAFFCSVLLAAVAVAGCNSTSRTVVIGYAFPYHLAGALRVANEEIAERAPRRGPRISVVYDSVVAGDPADVEVRRAERLAAIPGIVGVVGHGGSRASLAAAPVYNEAGIVQITPTSTSRVLKSAGPWTFNLAPDDSIEGSFIGEFVAERLRAGSVTLYYVNDEFGVGLRDGAVAELARRGVAVLDRVPMDITSDFQTLVAASLKRGKPDVVVVAGRQNETGTIARLMRERGVPRPVVAGDGALVLPALADVAGPAADSIYVVAFWMPDAQDSVSRAFVQRHLRLAGLVPQSADAMSHDALLLLAEAIHEVGSDRAAVREYLAELGRSRPPYQGVTGPISFAPGAPSRLIMARLHGGALRRMVAP
jgi:branched-chain amino acid transport system substrate-binding protein